jgi:PBP1b-binding outer membrane lipoprotein LpoB
MPNTTNVLFLSIFLLFLTGCSSRFAEPEDVSSFCENVTLGSDFSAVLASLPSQALEARELTPALDQNILASLNHTESVQSALITAEGLERSNVDPACLIYFSSILEKGDGKIVYKQFIGETNQGARS